MKISPLFDAVHLFNQVQGRIDRKTGGMDRDADGRQAPQDQGSGDDSSNQNPSEQSSEQRKRFAEKMSDAVEGFAKDPQARASGLTASQEGEGPGLKIVLKDANGGVVRQFSGEEFMRLREAVSKDRRSRGKILDQKL